MASLWLITVCEKDLPLYSNTFTGAVELGRQAGAEREPCFETALSDRRRLIMARRDDHGVSRKHVLLEPCDDGCLRVENLSASLPVGLPGGATLEPKTSCTIQLPAVIEVGGRSVHLRHGEPAQGSLRSLSEATLAPGASAGGLAKFSTRETFVGRRAAESKAIIRWLQRTMEVLQSACGSEDFFLKAAQAVVDIVGLDSGQVVLLENGAWRTQAYRAGRSQTADGGPGPSRSILGLVLRDKRTFWESSPAIQDPPPAGRLSAVVCSPILDRSGAVIGAIYGDRHETEANVWQPAVTELEAMLVELIACGVAAGLARLEEEHKALTARTQFEQFFTAELSRCLAAQPDLLQGRDSEVTLLFCDIRGSCRIVERLGAVKTTEWIQDALGALSGCAQAHGGVLSDYRGDALTAMWGAPARQPEHARLACRAALDMLGVLPELNARWQPLLNEPMDLSIGLNTGVTRVGNIGSKYKFKYGALGNAVNLASRVEGATKYLGTRLLITGTTRAQLDDAFPVRRVCRVRVVNITEPVDLYELAAAGLPDWPRLRQQYETALDLFERQEFHGAIQIAGDLLAKHPQDGPTLALLSRSVNALLAPAASFDPVWELPGK